MNEMFSLDTHKTIVYLVNSGLKEKQAEAIVQTICDARESQVKTLVTKDNLAQSELLIRQEIKDVETRLSAEIKDVETRLSAEIRAIDNKFSLSIEELRASMYKMDASMKTWFVSVMLGMSALMLSGMGILIKFLI